jgi:hypothetical protein
MATLNPGRFNPRIPLRRTRFRSRHTKPRRRRRSRIQDCTHMPRIVRSRCEGARGKRCSRTRPTPPRPHRNGAKVHHHCIPPPSASPQVSVRTSPASTVARTQTSARIPHGPRRRPSALPRLRRSQACGRWPCWPTHPRGFGYPHRVHERAPNRRFRRSGALSARGGR